MFAPPILLLEGGFYTQQNLTVASAYHYRQETVLYDTSRR